MKKSLIRRRVLSYAIDLLLIQFAVKFMIFALGLKFARIMQYNPQLGLLDFFAQAHQLNLAFMGVFSFIYFIAAPWYGQGQTLGQKLTGLRTFLTGPESFKTWSIRSAHLTFNGFFMGLPFLIILLHPQNKGLHDLTSGTYTEELDHNPIENSPHEPRSWAA